MLVEPDPLLRRSFARMARRFGVRFSPVASGAQALSALRDGPALLICAYRLPDMNGAQLLAQVRRLLPDALLVLSSGMMGEVAVGPGVRWVPKPIDLGAFGRLVQDATRGPR